jgi:CHAT domain-containing protein
MTNISKMAVRTSVAILLALALVRCTPPPHSVYESQAAANTSAGLPVGANTAGESCTLQRSGATADIYCGSWDQPSAHVQIGTAAAPGDLAALATTSSWRAGLEGAYACTAPRPTTILDDAPAEALSCTQRFGGWPHIALVSVIGGTAYYADGVLPALPAMQRAMGVMSGKIPPSGAGQASVAASDQILAQRLAAQAFSSGDIGQYEALMALGSKVNQEEDFPAAVIAYRAALALQQRKLGADNPATVAPMLDLALNLSDQAQYPEAASLFAAAAKLVPASSDPTAAAKLLHYEGLDQLNQGNPAQALKYLQQAELLYAAMLPANVLQAAPAVQSNEALVNISARSGTNGLMEAQATLNSPVTQTALLGVIETWRYQAIALYDLGDKKAGTAALATAHRIAEANDISPPMLDARLDRTSGALATTQGRNGAAVSELQQAAVNFDTVIPGSRPVAETALLQGGVLLGQKQDAAALASCRKGISLLRTLKLGTSPELIAPCLDAFAASASADPAQAQAMYGEMFAAAELAQGSVTSQEIAEAAARLSTSSSNPKVAQAIRAQQDAQTALVKLYQQRDELSHASGAAGSPAALAALDKNIAAANATVQQATLAEQAAAPNFGQLVQQVVPVKDVLALLRPDEAFLAITAGPDHTWLFFLHDGSVQVARSATNDTSMGGLVTAVRASIEPTQAGLPRFDMADATTIYDDTLGPFAASMNNVHELVIAPSGPLLALPFALLPTGPASPTDLANAPWLIRQTTLAYVPAAANFVSLRKIAGTSAAQKPWFGFGDFRPVTLAQAQATYNVATCQDSAALFANLPNLPYAKLELQAAGATFGAGPEDELLGSEFTVPNVEKADLKNFRILHFATHALLPTDLPCQTQPAIVTSAPPGAASANDALLNTNDVTNLHLDADLVLLSACNTGGGADGGEALSGLARSFFYAGARALMVTQWSVNDQVSAYLVADTMSRLHGGQYGGVAGSLRAAQLGILSGAGHTLPASIADPFYWSAFAVIGDGGNTGGNSGGTQRVALSGTASAGL